jgi:ParB-like chromosome segregation protein Spo0J
MLLTRYEARWAHAELLARRGYDEAWHADALDPVRTATSFWSLRLRKLAGR